MTKIDKQNSSESVLLCKDLQQELHTDAMHVILNINANRAKFNVSFWWHIF